MELDVGRDESGDKLCISRSTSSTASNVVRDEVYLIYASSACAFRSSVVLQQTFSQFLSATIGPLVARVSAPRTMPSSKRQPTMVVPVLVALGTATPLASRNSLRMVFEKSKPAPRYTEDDDEAAIRQGGQVRLRVAQTQEQIFESGEPPIPPHYVGTYIYRIASLRFTPNPNAYSPTLVIPLNAATTHPLNAAIPLGVQPSTCLCGPDSSPLKSVKS